MKQRISISQLNQLSDNQKRKLRNYWKPKFYKYVGSVVDFEDEITIDTEGTLYTISFLKDEFMGITLPLLNIGQMIELLDDYNAPLIRVKTVNELCDFLWKEIKEIL